MALPDEDLVLCLTGAGLSGLAPADALALTTAALPRSGARVVRANRWTINLHLAGYTPSPSQLCAAQAALREQLNPRHIDSNILLARQLRCCRLLLSDMDLTLVPFETLDRLAELAGCGTEIAKITSRSVRGEMSFIEALRQRAALLEGASTELLDTVCAEIYPYPGAVELIAAMRARGVHTVLISGGLAECVSHAARSVGFDDWYANRFSAVGGRFTGRVLAPIIDGPGKAKIATEIAARLGCERQAVLAIGDGANDVAMLQSAGLGVAWRAVQIAKQAAHCILDHSRWEVMLHWTEPVL